MRQQRNRVCIALQRAVSWFYLQMSLILAFSLVKHISLLSWRKDKQWNLYTDYILNQRNWTQISARDQRVIHTVCDFMYLVRNVRIDTYFHNNIGPQFSAILHHREYVVLCEHLCIHLSLDGMTGIKKNSKQDTQKYSKKCTSYPHLGCSSWWIAWDFTSFVNKIKMRKFNTVSHILSEKQTKSFSKS